jgi:hypothetical protein
VVICGSKGGADHHPAWYLNIQGSEQRRLPGRHPGLSRRLARAPKGAEREKVWAFVQDCFPFYTSYQRSTERLLPLVMMKIAEPIAIFKESDATGTRQF